MGEKKDGHDNKDDGQLTVVFKVEFHCEGCAMKVVKAANSCGGVESAKADCDKSKLTVVGAVDPVKLRDKLEKKTKKKIVLVSPQPKEKKPDAEKKPDENKSKEKKAPESTTVVLSMHLHCEGCIEKIHTIISKTEGVEQVSFDRQKDLITVKVTNDVKDMLEELEKKMKRVVQIVPAVKSDAKDDGKEKKGAPKAPVADNGGQLQSNQWPRQMPPPMGWYGQGYLHNVGPAYPSYPVQMVHAPQIFSDENPNACSVM